MKIRSPSIILLSAALLSCSNARSPEAVGEVGSVRTPAIDHGIILVTSYSKDRDISGETLVFYRNNKIGEAVTARIEAIKKVDGIWACKLIAGGFPHIGSVAYLEGKGEVQ